MVDPPDQSDVFDGLFGSEQGRPAPSLDSRRAAPKPGAPPAPPPAGRSNEASPAAVPSGAPGDPVNALFRAETVLSAPPVEEGPSETELLRWRTAARPSLFEETVRDPAPAPTPLSEPPTVLDLDDRLDDDLGDEAAAMRVAPVPGPARPPLPPLPAAPLVGEETVHDPAPAPVRARGQAPVAPRTASPRKGSAHRRKRRRRRKAAPTRPMPWKLVAPAIVLSGFALVAAWMLWPGAQPPATPFRVERPAGPKPPPVNPKLFESSPEQAAATSQPDAKKAEATEPSGGQVGSVAKPSAMPSEGSAAPATEPAAKKAEAKPAPAAKPERSPHTTMLIEARKLRADDEPEQAEALARRALADNPNDHHAMVELARALIDQDRGAEAAAQMEKAVAKRRKRVSYRLLYGDALLMAGDEAGARAQWREAGEIAPTNQGVRQRLGI